MDKNADILFQYLRDVLYNPENAHLDTATLGKDFEQLGQGMQYLAACLDELRRFSVALAHGNLSAKLPSRDNELAAPLKSLQASLRHLTWQTQQVAKGDYKQQVDFMGDFAYAFNSMIHQLEAQRNALLSELERSRRHVQEGRRHIRELEDHAYIDTATGTFNRYYGMMLLQQWVDVKKEFALCFVDMDNLKYVNDTYGHSQGDEYIFMVAEHMKGIETGTLVSRLGGDEFMVLLDGCGEEDALRIMAGLREKVVAESANLPYLCSVSYGVVFVGFDNNQTASKLLGVADERMYEFKHTHKKQRGAKAEAVPPPPANTP